MIRTDEQRRITAANIHGYVRPRHRIRRAIRKGKHHAIVLARHPEVREIAKHAAIVGGAYLAVKKLPYLRYQAVRQWRRISPPGSPARRALLHYVHSAQAGKRIQREQLRGSALRVFDKAARRRRAQTRLKKLLGT